MARDLALVLDVARFKYPPHWVAAERLWSAMQAVDPTTGQTRGWMALRRRAHGIALGFSLSCDGENWHWLARRLTVAVAQLGDAADIAALSRAVAPLTAHVTLRAPSAAAHRNALTAAREVLR